VCFRRQWFGLVGFNWRVRSFGRARGIIKKLFRNIHERHMHGRDMVGGGFSVFRKNFRAPAIVFNSCSTFLVQTVSMNYLT
jgi:hypothetical protein